MAKAWPHSSPISPGPSFLLRFAILFFGWLLIHQQLIQPYTRINEKLIEFEVQASAQILKLLNHNTEIGSSTPGVNDRLYISDSYGSVVVKPDCNGLDFMAMVPTLMIAYPATWRKRWHILPAMALVGVLNILRIAALTWIQGYHHEYLDFNHTYTFNALLAGVVLFYFYRWLKA